MEKSIVKKYVNDYFFNDYTPLIIAFFFHFTLYRFIGHDIIYKEFFACVAVVQAVIFEVSLLNKSDKTAYYGKGDFKYFIIQIFISIFFIIVTFGVDYYLLFIENQNSFKVNTVITEKLFVSSINASLLFDFFYFSITTFSTTGYGDMQPFSNLARLFCVIQITISFFVAYYVLNYFSDNLENSKKLINALLNTKESIIEKSNDDKKNENSIRGLLPAFITILVLTLLFHSLSLFLTQTQFVVKLEKVIYFSILIIALYGVIDFIYRLIRMSIKDMKTFLPLHVSSRQLLVLYFSNVFILGVSYFLFGKCIGNYLAVLCSIAIPVIYYYSINLRLFDRRAKINLILIVMLSLIPYIISYAVVMFIVSFYNPGAFHLQSPNPEYSFLQISDFLYYSVVTFSTTGYGDIYPVSTLSKFLISIKLFSNLFIIFYFVSNILNVKAKTTKSLL
ncbi:MAG: two pore domain potassium channel family protein [Chitinophagales bacterium]|nr:two pore domain potassium channel family protein [Chitinophagales bacterium]